jgi:hypothetical protein
MIKWSSDIPRLGEYVIKKPNININTVSHSSKLIPNIRLLRTYFYIGILLLSFYLNFCLLNKLYILESCIYSIKFIIIYILLWYIKYLYLKYKENINRRIIILSSFLFLFFLYIILLVLLFRCFNWKFFCYRIFILKIKLLIFCLFTCFLKVFS